MGGWEEGSICLFHSLQGLLGAARTENHRRDEHSCGAGARECGRECGRESGGGSRARGDHWCLAGGRAQVGGTGIGRQGRRVLSPHPGLRMGRGAGEPWVPLGARMLAVWGEVRAGRVGVSRR